MLSESQVSADEEGSLSRDFLLLVAVMQRCEEHLAALNRRLDHLFNFPDDPRNTPPDLYKPRTLPSEK